MKRPANEETRAVGPAGPRVKLRTGDRANCAASRPQVKGPSSLLGFRYVQTPAYLRGDAGTKRRELFIAITRARYPTAVVRVASCS